MLCLVKPAGIFSEKDLLGLELGRVVWIDMLGD